MGCTSILGCKQCNTLPTSPQPLSRDNFKPINVQNSPKMCFGPKIPKYGNSAPDPPKWIFFWIFHFGYERLTNTLPTSPQPLSEVDFKPRYDFFPIFAENSIKSRYFNKKKQKKSIFQLKFFQMPRISQKFCQMFVLGETLKMMTLKTVLIGIDRLFWFLILKIGK